MLPQSVSGLALRPDKRKPSCGIKSPAGRSALMAKSPAADNSTCSMAIGALLLAGSNALIKAVTVYLESKV